jgi:hypothetical protein
MNFSLEICNNNACHFAVFFRKEKYYGNRAMFVFSFRSRGHKHEDVHMVNLIFIGPCIIIYSYSTTKTMHLLSKIIYSCKTLYIFRTVFPSIIRSSELRIQQRYMSNSCCYLLLWGMTFHLIPDSSR